MSEKRYYMQHRRDPDLFWKEGTGWGPFDRATAYESGEDYPADMHTADREACISFYKGEGSPRFEPHERDCGKPKLKEEAPGKGKTRAAELLHKMIHRPLSSVSLGDVEEFIEALGNEQQPKPEPTERIVPPTPGEWFVDQNQIYTKLPDGDMKHIGCAFYGSHPEDVPEAEAYANVSLLAEAKSMRDTLEHILYRLGTRPMDDDELAKVISDVIEPTVYKERSDSL